MIGMHKKNCIAYVQGSEVGYFIYDGKYRECVTEVNLGKNGDYDDWNRDHHFTVAFPTEFT